jgi:hypothetical protein
MLLRYNRVLKIFAILLFSFELLLPLAALAAPAGLPAEIDHPANTLSELTYSADFLSHLLCEEVNNEEREGEDDSLISVCYVEIFSELQKFKPVNLSWSLPREQFDTEPSLFTLYRVFQI